MLSKSVMKSLLLKKLGPHPSFCMSFFTFLLHFLSPVGAIMEKKINLQKELPSPEYWGKLAMFRFVFSVLF